MAGEEKLFMIKKGKGIYIGALVALLVAVMAGGCRKSQQQLTAGGVLTFSTDTLKFDTVFTAQGSYTSGVVIYNPQSEAVVVSSVRMQGGAASYFHLNINGSSLAAATNLRIAAHDSMYVFATVTINPDSSNTPFFIDDFLVATMNGKDFSIPFTAYGQNAHYIMNDSITVNTTWLTDRPYVVFNKLAIGPGVALTIPKSCKVYMHQNARFFVYGALVVDPGGLPGKDSVVFQGDRLDRDYFGYIGYPGEWGGIYFVPGGFGLITDAVIKNCGGATPYYFYTIQSAAIEVDTAAKLYIDHSKVENSIGYGILSIQGSVVANNCLVSTTGAEALAIIQGGYDTITNCTFANYGTAAVSHATNGTVAILNYYRVDQNTIYFGNLNAVMENCIVYGSLDSEIVCDTSSSAGARLVVNNCLLKMGSVREPFVQFDATLFNMDPMFKDQNNGDFHLAAGSPAIAKGTTPATGVDLDGNSWSGNYDMGCYKYH